MNVGSFLFEWNIYLLFTFLSEFLIWSLVNQDSWIQNLRMAHQTAEDEVNNYSHPNLLHLALLYLRSITMYKWLAPGTSALD